eukprot:14592998-Alexandrium_andersonii.AAC.1
MRLPTSAPGQPRRRSAPLPWKPRTRSAAPRGWPRGMDRLHPLAPPRTTLTWSLLFRRARRTAARAGGGAG